MRFVLLRSPTGRIVQSQVRVVLLVCGGETPEIPAMAPLIRPFVALPGRYHDTP